MKNIIAISLVLFLFSCNEKGKKLSEDIKITKVDSVVENQVESQSEAQSAIGLVYEYIGVRIYGDTTIRENQISSVQLMFVPYIGFDDFKVDKIDHKKYAPLDLKSNSIANSYRTRLRNGYDSDSANFAGHYTFVYFGCGCPCQGSFIIDRQTGKVYDSPTAFYGYDFGVDSRMLIVNPPDTSGFYDNSGWGYPRIYVFDEKTKIFEERKPR